MQKVDNKKLYRIVDANFNRAKEGLRVCEDICRFLLDEKYLTRELKNLRHKLTDVILSFNFKEIIQSRNIEGDIGTGSSASEFKRKEIADIFYANTQRVKESIRVLEEFTKLLNKNKAQDLKALRYKFYALEKKAIKKV
ncbi:MAG: thiamine-phosphate pyrophosphorylase [Candidatus Zapsychrus exili]|nr:thiamine-phosphate pyrophosphorylase [Candidatus Zapsychrus exili]